MFTCVCAGPHSACCMLHEYRDAERADGWLMALPCGILHLLPVQLHTLAFWLLAHFAPRICVIPQFKHCVFNCSPMQSRSMLSCCGPLVTHSCAYSCGDFHLHPAYASSVAAPNGIHGRGLLSQHLCDLSPIALQTVWCFAVAACSHAAVVLFCCGCMQSCSRLLVILACAHPRNTCRIPCLR